MGLSETIEVKLELSRERTEAIKKLLDDVKKAIEKYERDINAIHIRNPKSD